MKNKIGYLAELLKNLHKKGLSDIFLSSVFSEFIAFIVSIVIVRQFSKEDYGYYAVAYNIYGYIAVFIGLGLTNGVLQYCSEKRVETEKSAIYSFCLKAGEIFNIVLLFFIPIFSRFLLGIPARNYLIWMSGWPLVAFVGNYMQIKLRVARDNRHFMLSNVSSSVVFLILAFVLSKSYGIEGYIVALYGKHALTGVISYTFSKQKETVNSGNIAPINIKLKKEILKYSIVCCLTNFTSTLMMLLDVTCINHFIGDPAIVATYKVATQIPTALTFIPSSIMVFIFPYFVEHNDNPHWLQKNTNKLLAGVFGLNVCVSIAIIILAPFIVAVLWGNKYRDAVLVLRMLVFNYLISGTFNMVLGNVMVAIKKVNINLIRTIFCSALNIILNCVLIKRYGSVGAAYATITVSIVSAGFAISYFKYWIKKKL